MPSALVERELQIGEFEAIGTRGSALERRVQLFGSPRTGSVQKGPNLVRDSARAPQRSDRTH